MPALPPSDPDRLAHFILRDMQRAVRAFAMLRGGERIAVAVSGGKDSLALFDLLHRLNRQTAIPFELAAIHVRGDTSGVTAPHAPLETWLAAQGVAYRIVAPELTEREALPLDCQRCTWLRRKALFEAAETLGCNVLAYAHHADDVAQTTLLNLLYGGNVHTLAPVADYFAGRFRLIRPLFYVPESALAHFARASGFPAPPPRCPRSDDSRRLMAAQMLKLMGRDYLKQGRANLIRAGLRASPADTQYETRNTQHKTQEHP